MGIAGRIASGFLRSKLTPLVTIASLLVGLLALAATPREEEPQISVPMIDVFSALPGASPAEVEHLVTVAELSGDLVTRVVDTSRVSIVVSHQLRQLAIQPTEGSTVVKVGI